MDFGLHYDLNTRWSVSASLPFQMADRSNPIRDGSDEVIGRSMSRANGIGDVTVTARRWMFDPATHTRGNIKCGIGIKLPTGAPNVVDTRLRFVDPDDDGPEPGSIVQSFEHADQSIQPGDGGFGVLLDFQSFYRIAKDKAALYGSATYLISPQGENGVTRGSGTNTNSITDFYVARAGVTWIPGSGRFGYSLGGRFEGTPWNDLVGSNAGFRRPGYTISVEPSFSWGRGVHAFTFSAPIALVRNRLANEADRADGEGPGDAAFADFSLLAAYFRRF